MLFRSVTNNSKNAYSGATSDILNKLLNLLKVNNRSKSLKTHQGIQLVVRGLDDTRSRIQENRGKEIYLLDCERLFVNNNSITNVKWVFNEQEDNTA